MATLDDNLYANKWLIKYYNLYKNSIAKNNYSFLTAFIKFKDMGQRMGLIHFKTNWKNYLNWEYWIEQSALLVMGKIKPRESFQHFSVAIEGT